MIAMLGIAMIGQLQAIILLTSELKASVPLGLTTIQRARRKFNTPLMRNEPASSQVQRVSKRSNAD